MILLAALWVILLALLAYATCAMSYMAWISRAMGGRSQAVGPALMALSFGLAFLALLYHPAAFTGVFHWMGAHLSPPDPRPAFR